MDPVTLGILIGSLVLSAGGLGAGIWGVNKANQTNIDLAKQGQDFEREMVELQNQYNSPLQQMQRYEQAGLNPRLMYQGGNQSAGNQTTTPRAHVPTVQNTMQNAMKTDPLGTLMQYQKIRTEAARADHEAMKIDLTGNKILTEIARESGISFDNIPKYYKSMILHLADQFGQGYASQEKWDHAMKNPFWKNMINELGITEMNLKSLVNNLEKSDIDLEKYRKIAKMQLSDPQLKVVQVLGNMITDVIPNNWFTKMNLNVPSSAKPTPIGVTRAPVYRTGPNGPQLRGWTNINRYY